MEVVFTTNVSMSPEESPVTAFTSIDVPNKGVVVTGTIRIDSVAPANRAIIPAATTASSTFDLSLHGLSEVFYKESLCSLGIVPGKLHWMMFITRGGVKEEGNEYCSILCSPFLHHHSIPNGARSSRAPANYFVGLLDCYFDQTGTVYM